MLRSGTLPDSTRPVLSFEVTTACPFSNLVQLFLRRLPVSQPWTAPWSCFTHKPQWSGVLCGWRINKRFKCKVCYSVVHHVGLHRFKQDRREKIRARGKNYPKKSRLGWKLYRSGVEIIRASILSLLWLKSLFKAHRSPPGPDESPIFHSLLVKPGSKFWQTTIDNERRLTKIDMKILRFDHIQNEGIRNRYDPWFNPWWKQSCLICSMLIEDPRNPPGLNLWLRKVIQSI